VAWNADDLDGDATTATLLYSPNAGLTWLPVASDIAGTEALVDSNTLPGSTQALMRVIVTDGFHTVVADSDSIFTVADKAPTVEIFGPEEINGLNGGEPQTFTGIARDPQGFALPDDGFIWMLDGEAVGVGNPLELRPEPGDRVLTLLVEGDNGLAGEATREFVVSDFDSDGDGVPDNADACPASPQIATVIVGECVAEAENRILMDGCTVTERLDAESSLPGKLLALNQLHRDGDVGQRGSVNIRLCIVRPE
jgi:hypothetical protein